MSSIVESTSPALIETPTERVTIKNDTFEITRLTNSGSNSRTKQELSRSDTFLIQLTIKEIEKQQRLIAQRMYAIDKKRQSIIQYLENSQRHRRDNQQNSDNLSDVSYDSESYESSSDNPID